MTTTSMTTTTGGDDGVLLADALSANVLLSTATGLSLTAGAWALDAVLGLPTVVLVALGIGLLGFATAIVGALARPERLRSAARVIVGADLGWVVGAVAVVGSDLLTPSGDVALVVVTTAVAALAAIQLTGLRRSGDADRVGVRPVTLSAHRVVHAHPDDAWRLVADAAGYAAFAPTIAATATDGPVAEGMQRTCVDTGGRSWSETCHVIAPGRCYRMEVDVDSYPLRYRLLFDHFGMGWDVARHPRGSELTLTFSGAVKLGVLGRLGVGLLARTAPQDEILDRYVATIERAEAT